MCYDHAQVFGVIWFPTQGGIYPLGIKIEQSKDNTTMFDQNN